MVKCDSVMFRASSCQMVRIICLHSTLFWNFGSIDAIQSKNFIHNIVGNKNVPFQNANLPSQISFALTLFNNNLPFFANSWLFYFTKAFILHAFEHLKLSSQLQIGTVKDRFLRIHLPFAFNGNGKKGFVSFCIQNDFYLLFFVYSVEIEMTKFCRLYTVVLLLFQHEQFKRFFQQCYINLLFQKTTVFLAFLERKQICFARLKFQYSIEEIRLKS